MSELIVLEPLSRLSKDIKQAASTLSHDEARYLVDAYYQMQGDRIRSDNQVRALSKSEEPHQTLDWLAVNAATLERNIKSALDVYSEAHQVGRWSKSIVGIGPVLAAGLLAHIDITKAPTVGHIWRFAGLDPTVTWNKATKRPWNASLKTLCWKIGESFVKVSGRDEDVYGKLYLERKAAERARNEAGQLADQAAAKLAKFKFDKDTEGVLWYQGRLTPADAAEYYATPTEQRLGLAKRLAKGKAAGAGVPMLPPAHVQSRAKRWAVKLFLAHWHAVAYRAHFGETAPKPYVVSQLQHGHEIAVPNWPF